MALKIKNVLKGKIMNKKGINTCQLPPCFDIMEREEEVWGCSSGFDYENMTLCDQSLGKEDSK